MTTAACAPARPVAPAAPLLVHRTYAGALAVLALALAARGAGAQTPPAASTPARPGTGPAATQPWTPEDVVMAERAAGFRVSPDGTRVIWVKSTAEREKDGRVSNLMLSSLAEQKTTVLTRGADTHSSPRWSPGGVRIAFLSTRPRRMAAEGEKKDPKAGQPQLWLIDPAGGEPWPLTEFTRGIRAFEWLDDDHLVFSAEEEPTLREQTIEKKKDESRVVDDEADAPPVRLFKLAVPAKSAVRLTGNTDRISEWALAPNGRFVVARHDRSLRYQWDQAIPPRYVLHDLATGEARPLFADGRVRPEAFHWAQDSAGVYALAPFTTHPRFTEAWVLRAHYVDAASGAATEVDLGWDRGLAAFGFEATPDGFVASVADGARPQLARYRRSAAGWAREPITGSHARHVFAFTLSKDARTLVYEHSTASTPTQWWAAPLDGSALGAARQLTDLNARLKRRTIARTEIIRWKGANGAEIEGLLHYPHGYEAGRRYPLLTAPHGGPFGADYDTWDESYAYAANLLNQRGAFVLRPNYHGSSDYGLAFAESICCGKYYELPVADIEAGVDHLVAQGLADPDRIGTFGWSNGSILSIAVMLANPARYKAAAVGAGDIEWISDWANVDFGHAFDSYYFGASPLENPQRYIELSPFFKMDRVQTPTLIFFGTEDRNVPTGQGWSHFRALQHLGKVPVKFILFPGEPHGLQKLTHQIRKLEEEMAWFDRYLFKTEVAANPAFKEDSPLGDALRRRGFKRVGALYGEQAAGSRPAGPLVPETVSRTLGGKTVRVARFEVTRAQFAAFDRTYRHEPGTGNHPANGVVFERARAYVDWLSGVTGQTWRLPSEDEAATLYGGREGENTLDHWAGYAVNPDDAARLEAKVQELGSGAPLLREVGSFKGAGEKGEEPIFDLGGNVAEWIVTAGGTGRAVGGSADRPADTRALSAKPGEKVAPSGAAPAYVGFRVVLDVPGAR